MRFPVTCGLMTQGLEERVFTAASLVVVREDRVVLQENFGATGEDLQAAVTDETRFDLASLTKVLAVTPSWMKLAADRLEILDEPLPTWFPDCPQDKRTITPRLLLAHRSGLPAWRPYYLFHDPSKDRPGATRDRIFSEDLEYPPGDGSLYSDLGFMLLAWVIQAHTGSGLDSFAERSVFRPLGLEAKLLFTPSSEAASIAPTRKGDPPGIVNDLNARALGGIAGHAGLFGTAKGVAQLAAEFLRSFRSADGFFDHAVTRLFFLRVGSDGESTRALGFDTPSVTGSSSGGHFSPGSVGHTGFTGTSLWIDPEKDLIVVLLTNRVFMGESDFRIKDFRPAVHDAVVEEL